MEEIRYNDVTQTDICRDGMLWLQYSYSIVRHSGTLAMYRHYFLEVIEPYDLHIKLGTYSTSYKETKPSKLIGCIEFP